MTIVAAQVEAAARQVDTLIDGGNEVYEMNLTYNGGSGNGDLVVGYADTRTLVEGTLRVSISDTGRFVGGAEFE